MLNLDPEKLLMIGVLALLVLGPTRLPAAARSVGRVVAQLRRMSGSFQTELRDALAEPRQVLQHAVDEFGIKEVRSTMTSVADSFRPFSPGSSTPDPSALGSASPGAPTSGVPAVPIDPPSLAGGSAPVPDDPSLN